MINQGRLFLELVACVSSGTFDKILLSLVANDNSNKYNKNSNDNNSDNDSNVNNKNKKRTKLSQRTFFYVGWTYCGLLERALRRGA